MQPLTFASLSNEANTCELRDGKCRFGGIWETYHSHLNGVAACESDAAGGCRMSPKFAEARSAMKVQTLVSTVVAW